MIAIEKIKIFDSYGGDIDGLARVGRDYEKKLFDNNDWFLIENFHQDIELINKRLAARTYIEQLGTRQKLYLTDFQKMIPNRFLSCT